MTTYDPTSLLSNLKRTFSGFGNQSPMAKPASPAPFAIPKPAPFAMPTAGPAPTMGPVAQTNPMQGPAPFIGPRPVAPVIAPPVATATHVAPVVPRTSTGQTINTATGGIIAGSTTTTPQVQPVPTYGASVTDSMGRTGEAKFDPNTGLPLTNPTPAVPIVPPSAEQTAVTSAEQAYKTAGATTPEQDAAQAELDRLQESVRSGYTGAGQQAIPMEFITGQQKAIEQRGLRLAEPLTAKLARMEAKRLSGLATSKFALERADTALATTSAAKTAEANAKESARRFGIEQSGTAETRALAEKKFAEDNRQFGLDYAIKQRDMKIKEGEAVTKAAEAATKAKEGQMTPAMAQDLQDKAKNIQTLIDDPALTDAVGPNPLARTSFTTAFTGARQNFVGGVKQLTSKETLDTLTNLKAKGGTLGALSDQERIMLQNAATKIGEWEMKDNGVGNGFYNVDEGSFKKELGTLKMLAERALTNAGISTGTPAGKTVTAPDGSQVIITD